MEFHQGDYISKEKRLLPTATSKYLTTTINEITGKSTGKIIEIFVVQEAHMLLDNPTLSIAQISDELNFSHQSFFGKFFKRLTGFSPSAYRKILINLNQ